MAIEARFSNDALLKLQQACELYITKLFNEALYLALHANRTTVCPRDLQMAHRKMPGFFVCVFF